MVALTIFFGAITFFFDAITMLHIMVYSPLLLCFLCSFLSLSLGLSPRRTKITKRKNFLFFWMSHSLFEPDWFCNGCSIFISFWTPTKLFKALPPHHAPKSHHHGSSTVFRNCNLHLCPLKRNVQFHPGRLSQDLAIYSSFLTTPFSSDWCHLPQFLFQEPLSQPLLRKWVSLLIPTPYPRQKDCIEWYEIFQN